MINLINCFNLFFHPHLIYLLAIEGFLDRQPQCLCYWHTMYGLLNNDTAFWLYIYIYIYIYIYTEEYSR